MNVSENEEEQLLPWPPHLLIVGRVPLRDRGQSQIRSQLVDCDPLSEPLFRRLRSGVYQHRTSPQSQIARSSIHRFVDDEGFMSAMLNLLGTRTAWELFYVPTLLEMRTSPLGRPNFEVQGIAEAKGNSLLTSLEHMTGGKVGYLYDHYLPDQKPDPLSLVVSEEDSHPNPKGNRVLVDAIVDALKDAPPTKHLFE